MLDGKQVQEIVSALRPGRWWARKTVAGTTHFRIVEVFSDILGGLSVAGHGPLDAYIRDNECTIVCLVEAPPEVEEWSAESCSRVADALAELESQRDGSCASLENGTQESLA